VSLVELCRNVLDRTDAWAEVEALDDAARISARLNLYRFLDLAEEWSPLEGAPSLAAFLDHLDLLADETSSGELDTARVSGADAVPLLTVHRAKGLEWDVVFLPALEHQVFPSRVIQFEDPVTVPSVLPYALRLDVADLPELPEDGDERRDLLREAHDDQEWRTAYVAVTRARHSLYGSGAFWTGGANPRDPSRLFDIIDAVAAPAPGRCVESGSPPPTGAAATQPRSPSPDGGAWPPPPRCGDTAARRGGGLAAPYDRAVDQCDRARRAPEPAEAETTPSVPPR
jgi:DNA helicase-2/ATP-dependent DNA helicase PcrA